MPKGKTPYQVRQEAKNDAQTAALCKQEAEIAKNRREGRGGMKEKGIFRLICWYFRLSAQFAGRGRDTGKFAGHLALRWG